MAEPVLGIGDINFDQNADLVVSVEDRARADGSDECGCRFNVDRGDCHRLELRAVHRSRVCEGQLGPTVWALSIGQETAGLGQELVQLVMVRPVSGALDVQHLRVLKVIDPAVGRGIRCPRLAAANQQRRARDAAP